MATFGKSLFWSLLIGMLCLLSFNNHLLTRNNKSQERQYIENQNKLTQQENDKNKSQLTEPEIEDLHKIYNNIQNLSKIISFEQKRYKALGPEHKSEGTLQMMSLKNEYDANVRTYNDILELHVPDGTAERYNLPKQLHELEIDAYAI